MAARVELKTWGRRVSAGNREKKGNVQSNNKGSMLMQGVSWILQERQWPLPER